MLFGYAGRKTCVESSLALLQHVGSNAALGEGCGMPLQIAHAPAHAVAANLIEVLVAG
jgi:hypothetical protein